MRKTIQIPQYVYQGITRSNRGFGEYIKVFGCDHETVYGKVHTLQIKDHTGRYLYYVNKKTVFMEFLYHVDSRLKRGETAVCYFHNLNFDLPVLFSAEPIENWNLSEFEVEAGDWKVKVNCEKRFFAKLSKGGKKQIIIVDSFSYLSKSLEKVATCLHIPFKKLPKPEGLGKIAYTDAAFEEYALADVDIEYEFGQWIVKLHEKYDVPISVSFPQLCATIFKRQFLRKGDVIQMPPKDVLIPSLLSYHGGKNGLYAEAGKYNNCTEIDINSAYPWAMKQLPSFLKGEYLKVSKFYPQYQGVYRVSGRINCPYNLLFDHSFRPLKGPFKHIWITGHEIQAGLEYKELEIDEITGHVWVPDEKETRNPFADYVDYFYKLKTETPKTDPMYNFYKLALNQLYGKLIQAVEVRKVDGQRPDAEVKMNKEGKMIVEEQEKLFTAGGMFNPFLGSQITAMCRVKLHSLEHRFKAIHSATDSIKTLLPVTGCSEELGGYKEEVKGTCLIFRNKCYLHYNGNVMDPTKLVKFATHGFAGRVKDLIELYENKSNTYTVERMLKIREGLRQRKTPLTMIEVTRNFGIDWKKFNESPKVY